MSTLLCWGTFSPTSSPPTRSNVSRGVGSNPNSHSHSLNECQSADPIMIIPLVAADQKGKDCLLHWSALNGFNQLSRSFSFIFYIVSEEVVTVLLWHVWRHSSRKNNNNNKMKLFQLEQIVVLWDVGCLLMALKEETIFDGLPLERHHHSHRCLHS